jgi:hypothetical protein
MANYFVRRQSKVFGPLTGEDVLNLAKSGKVHPTDEIANDRNGPWKPATSIGALQSVFGQSGPDPQPRASAPFQSAGQRPGQPKVARGVSLNAQLKEFGMGTSSVHMGNPWLFLSVLFFPLVTVFFIILAKNYGRPTICKVPLATGSSGNNPVAAITAIFLRRGFSKRTHWLARIGKGTLLKCPGARVAMRDVQIRHKNNSVYVTGWRKDIVDVLVEAGVLSH